MKFPRVGRRLGVVLLLSAILLPTAATPVRAGYVGTCTVNGDDNYHGYMESTPGSVDYYAAEVVYLRDMPTCNNVIFGPQGATFVLPVNIQDWAFVQLGYGHLDSDAPLKFLWTQSETSGGTLTEMTGVENPQLGHNYLFRVYYLSGSGRWRYRVTDLTDGSDQWQDGDVATRLYGTKVWSGFEVYHINDQYGGADIWTTINHARYELVGQATQHYLSDRYFVPCCGTQMSYWTSTVGDDAGTDYSYIRAKTLNH